MSARTWGATRYTPDCTASISTTRFAANLRSAHSDTGVASATQNGGATMIGMPCGADARNSAMICKMLSAIISPVSRSFRPTNTKHALASARIFLCRRTARSTSSVVQPTRHMDLLSMKATDRASDVYTEFESPTTKSILKASRGCPLYVKLLHFFLPAVTCFLLS